MANGSIKKLETNYKQAYATGSSFAIAMENAASIYYINNYNYVGSALDTLRTGISGYNTGMHSLSSSGGPGYGVCLYKLNNTYFGGLLLSYDSKNIGLWFGYTNGSCWVKNMFRE